LRYEARLAAVDGFFAAISDFVAEGGRGANVTVPFKEEAYRRCDRLTDRAARAGAVNTLQFIDGGVHGDNTDGAGLVRDISVNLGRSLAGQRILLLGAGGASRGVIAPLLAEKPAVLVIANRSPDKAQQLAATFADLAAGAALTGGAFAQLAGQQFDIVINATSASLSGDSLPLPAGIFASGSLAYDMMYGKGETPFLALARIQGAAHCADGLGMLVEQAAEAFTLWRGKRPETTAVLASLRVALGAQG